MLPESKLDRLKLFSYTTIFLLYLRHFLDTDTTRCDNLLTSKGSYIYDHKYKSNVYQPSGCMYHNYTSKDVRTCLKITNTEKEDSIERDHTWQIVNDNGVHHLSVIGDSRARQIFNRFVGMKLGLAETMIMKSHENINDEELNLSLNWAESPSDIAKYFSDFNKLIKGEEIMDSQIKLPNLVLIESGLWTIKATNGNQDGISEFKKQLLNLKEEMILYSEKLPNSKIIWLLNEDTDYENLKETRQSLTLENIKSYNNVIEEVLKKDYMSGTVKTLRIMSSNRLLLDGTTHKLSDDGLHYINPDEQTSAYSQELNTLGLLIANVFCNSINNPSQASCCMEAEPKNSIQIICSIFVILSTIFYFYINNENKKIQQEEAKALLDASNDPEKAANADIAPAKTAKTAAPSPLADILFNIIKFGLIMYFFWLCDRSNSFAFKINKHYSFLTFSIILTAICIACIFFGGWVPVKQAAMLNREQTSEWKGWMQLVILVYHITGASVHVPVYMHMRLLVGAYLFQTGYGHMCYAVLKADYSWNRVAKVMFRLNFLTLALCWVMNRPWQFYYFIPLCAFYFSLFYGFLALPFLQPEKISTAGGVSTEIQNLLKTHMKKVVLFTILIILLFVDKDFYQSLFSFWPMRPMFELPGGSGNIREWWFRSQLDMFAVPVGALFALTYMYFKEQGVFREETGQVNEKEGGNSKLYICDNKLAKFLIYGSILTYLIYAIHLSQCTDKAHCNSIHVYVSGLVIVAFVMVRNVSDYLRSHYSSRFAWFGNISLELFIGQYHIWLANDTKGILILFETWPIWVNLILSTVIFVCVAHEIHVITEKLAGYFVPKDNRTLMIRSGIVFLFIGVFSDDFRSYF